MGAPGGALGQVGHRRRVDAAGEEDRQRHVAGQVEPHALLQDARPGSSSSMVGSAGAVAGWARSPPGGTSVPGAVEGRRPARPEQLDPLDRRARADHEAVPDHRGHRLRVEAGRAQQARGQQGPQLGGEGQRPAGRRVAVARQVERLDAERIAGQQQLAAAPGPRRRRRTCRATSRPPRGPCSASARSMTAVSPVDWNRCPSAARRSPQLDVVVDLAVEDDHVARSPGPPWAGRRPARGRGWRGGGGPAARPSRGRPGADSQVAAGVRPAVDHGVAHPPQRGPVGLVDASDDACDSTHGSMGQPGRPFKPQVLR